MPATIQDIARELGLSHTTVSRVLNARDDRFISDATRQRVRHAAQRMGYQPNRMAQALVRGRSHLVQFLAQYVHPAYFSRTIQALQQQLRATPYELHIVETLDWTPEQWVTGAGAWPVDGTIVFEFEEAAGLQTLHAALGNRAPLVSLGGSFLRDVDHVGVDLYAGARAAVRHLWATGRRIAYVHLSSNRASTRAEGYADALREVGGTVEFIAVDMTPRETLRSAVRRGVAAYVEIHGCPDALFCFNDDAAIAALHALKDRGLRVPEDAALLGCDGIEDAEYQDPPISTLAVAYEEMARLAWEFLQRRMQEPDLPVQSAILTPELVLRHSSVPYAGQEVGAQQHQSALPHSERKGSS